MRDMPRPARPSPPPRALEYVRLDEVLLAPRNPKGHDKAAISRSISHHGFGDVPLRDDRTGRLVAGHGRHTELTAMHAAGQDPPDGITVDADGMWRMPVVTGWASRSDADAEAYLIGSNQIATAGGWDDGLLDVLTDLRESGLLDLTGFTGDDYRDLFDEINEPPPSGDGTGDAYTTAVNIPQYEVVGPEPAVTELRDETRADELRARIRAAEGIPDDIREYLLAAAARHTVFNYRKAAEFYPHATAEVQRLMEESALVIIDLDDAIRLGYAKLSATLEALRETDADDGE